MKITTASCSILLILIIVQPQHILAQEYAKSVTFSIEVDGVPRSMDVKFEDDVDVAAQTFCESIDNVEESCHKTLAFHIYSQFAEENAKLQRQDISVQYARIMLSLDPENRDAKMRLAKYLEDSGDMNGCIQIYRDMLSQNPNDKSALLNMATVFHKAGDLDRAVPRYYILYTDSPMWQHGRVMFPILFSVLRNVHRRLVRNVCRPSLMGMFSNKQ